MADGGSPQRYRKRPGWTRWRSCESKARFRREFEAQKQGKRHGLRAYPCRHCAGWHLSSKEER